MTNRTDFHVIPENTQRDESLTEEALLWVLIRILWFSQYNVHLYRPNVNPATAQTSQFLGAARAVTHHLQLCARIVRVDQKLEATNTSQRWESTEKKNRESYTNSCK